MKPQGKKLTFLPAGFLILSCLWSGAAEPPSWTDQAFVQDNTPWLTSQNPAGLLSLPVRQMSSVDLAGGAEGGGFINYYQSDNAFRYGLGTSSYRKMSEKTVLSGEISYDNFQGKHMSGSPFIDPAFHLFDIVEDRRFAGRKQKETYFLSGAVAHALSDRFFLGAKGTYTAANYAKMKDLRHVNSLLDFSFSPGVSLRTGQRTRLGLNYRYRRRVESVSFQQDGVTDIVYSALVSQGAFFGKRQVFGADSYLSSNKQPVYTVYHGGALQAGWERTGLSLFGEFAVRHRSGYYGIRSSKTVQRTADQGMEYALYGVAIARGHIRKRLEINASYTSETNSQHVFKYMNDPTTGNTVVQYFGKNEACRRNMLQADAVFTLYGNMNGLQPGWELSVGGDFYSRDLRASVYPFFRDQNILHGGGFLSGKKHFFTPSGMLTLNGRLSAAAGGGMKASDGTYTAVSSDQTRPDTNEEELTREFEYLTAPRTGFGAGIEYAAPLPRYRNLTVYAGLDGTGTSAFRTEILGKFFGTVSLRIGCRW